MKLSSQTIEILKNFASINNGILFKEGNKLSTVSASKTILAEANLNEEFPQKFGIYDLNQFLSVMSLYKNDAELDFDSVNVTFKQGRSQTKYRITDESMIVVPPNKQLALPSVDVQFSLTASDYDWLMTTAKVLQSPNIAVQSDGENVSLTTFDASNDSAHTNSIEIGEGNGQVYKLVFKTDNLKMIPGAYEAKISAKGISQFVNQSIDLTYWIAIEAGISKFGE